MQLLTYLLICITFGIIIISLFSVLFRQARVQANQKTAYRIKGYLNKKKINDQTTEPYYYERRLMRDPTFSKILDRIKLSDIEFNADWQDILEAYKLSHLTGKERPDL